MVEKSEIYASFNLETYDLSITKGFYAKIATNYFYNF